MSFSDIEQNRVWENKNKNCYVLPVVKILNLESIIKLYEKNDENIVFWEEYVQFSAKYVDDFE